MTLLLEDELLELEIGFNEVVDELLLVLYALEELLTVLLDELLEVESALVTTLDEMEVNVGWSLDVLEDISLLLS